MKLSMFTRPLKTFTTTTVLLISAGSMAASQSMGSFDGHICMSPVEHIYPAPGECGFNDLGANRGVFLVSSTDWGDGRGCVESRYFVRCLGP